MSNEPLVFEQPFETSELQTKHSRVELYNVGFDHHQQFIQLLYGWHACLSELQKKARHFYLARRHRPLLYSYKVNNITESLF